MNIPVPEVCRSHIDAYCKQCSVDDDELWIHPRDLNACGRCERQYARDLSFYDDDEPALCPGCGDLREDAAECRLCQIAIETRRADIALALERIAMNEAEIAEIERGDRHTDFHRGAAS